MRERKQGRRWLIKITAACGLLMLGPRATANPQVQIRRVSICLPAIGQPSADEAAEERRRWSSLLARQGFVDGRDVQIAITWSNLNEGAQGLEALAREVVASKPSVVVFRGLGWMRALLRATSDLPLVGFDAGLGENETDVIHSLGRPGKNVTGVAQPVVAVQQKRLEILKEILPHARRLGIIDIDYSRGISPSTGEELRLQRARHLEQLQATARLLQMELVLVKVAVDESPASVALALKKAGVDFADFMGSPFVSPELWEALIKVGIAGSHPSGGPGIERAGPLVSYISVGYLDVVAGIVGKILKGKTPAMIPLEGPREYHLVINLRTARALGLTVPHATLMRAHKILE